jgi:hypothetical protein
VCLEALEYALARNDPPQTIGQRWQEVHAGYVEKFGPEAVSWVRRRACRPNLPTRSGERLALVGVGGQASRHAPRW